MAVIVTMLRAVNVGGHNQVKMDALRALYKKLGLLDAETYVQSGNVVCRTSERNLTTLAAKIEEAILRAFGHRPAVIIRTVDQLRDVIARNPFADRNGIEPAKLLVSFLAAEPAPAICKKVLEISKTAPEEVFIDGREMYIYFPNGMGRPKLSWPVIERALAIPGTGRNWNTVLKLHEMAAGMESKAS